MRINIVSIVMFSVVLDMYAIEDQKNLKTLPIKLTRQQAEYVYAHATPYERQFMYTDYSEQDFIQVSRESLLAHELQKQLFLQNHSDRL